MRSEPAAGRLRPIAALILAPALWLLCAVAAAEDEDRALAGLARAARPASAASDAAAGAADPNHPVRPTRPMGQPLSRTQERLDWARRQDTPATWPAARWRPADAALLDAARAGEWAQVGAALTKTETPANPRDASGDHLLALAARAGRDEIVRSLLQRGAEIDRPGGDGFTALGAAAFAGQRSTVRLLLRQGADPAVRGAGGQTALHLAAAAGQLAVVEEFVRQRVDLEPLNGQRESALDLAATRGQLAVMDLLLKAGADLTRAGRR